MALSNSFNSGFCRLLFSGGTGPLVICSDCYDNANIYSRTREYCPYAYLAEDEPLVGQIPRDGHLNGLQEQDRHTEHADAPLEDLISQQSTSGFLTNHDPRLQASQQYSAGEINVVLSIISHSCYD